MILRDLLRKFKTMVFSNGRYLGRLRFIKKISIVIMSKDKSSILVKFKFILFSPETDTFSYSLIKMSETSQQLAKYFNVPQRQIELYMDEIHQNFSLHKLVHAKSLLRIFYLKNPIKLGRYYCNYVAIRAFHPDLVIESGTKFGIGALVIQEAIKKNEHGETLSLDIDPKAGVINRDNLIIGDSIISLSNLHFEYPKILLITDSVCDENHILSEINEIVRISRKAIMIIANYGWISEESLKRNFKDLHNIETAIISEFPERAIISERKLIFAFLEKCTSNQ